MMVIECILQLGYKLLNKGYIPDVVLRSAIRLLCWQRLSEIDRGSFEANHAAKMDWVETARARPTIADLTDTANKQHYEVPTDFMLSCLGPHAKYSCCLYPTGNESIEEAEVLMLENYCEKAQLINGLDILDLGCGWGSLTLYLAERYPKSRITGLSNSITQKAYIESVVRSRGLSNVEVITADVNHFDFSGHKHFDRILSIEMFEHMKNYKLLMSKVSGWLRPGSDALFLYTYFASAPRRITLKQTMAGWPRISFLEVPCLRMISFFTSRTT
ncbi:hypothetical protein AcV7_007136 [Taiwanofungus camphoratus]|nr:hypothetical protein AcV7_007136 [Antrodia cinnamomea]